MSAHPGSRAGILFIPYALVTLNGLATGGVRTSIPALNYWSFAGVQFAAAFCALRAFSASSRTRCAGLTALAVLLVVVAVPVGLITSAWAAVNAVGLSDPTFRAIRRLHTPAGRVVAYRSDGGATTDFGIVVRQECDVAPGLFVVRELAATYHEDDARLELVAPDEVLVTFPPYGERRTEERQARALRSCFRLWDLRPTAPWRP